MLNRYINTYLHYSLDNFSAVALMGARQIGKTTLAKSLVKSTDILYLDLESPADLAKLNDPIGFFNLHHGKLLILDEIQHYPELFSVLRGVIDTNRQQGQKTGQFLLLGSASMDLLRQSSESLAGRIDYVNMFGFNIFETGPTQKNIRNLWFRGGFPDSYLTHSDNQAMIWLNNLIRTYIERDVPQMGFNIPAERLRRLWIMLAHLQGETVNYTKLAGNLEVDAKTVKYYMNILVDLLLVRRLKPWHANVKKRLVKSPRYYIRDTGIAHCLLGINSYDELLGNPVLGKSWEGFVIENIHSVLPRRAETYFYRTTVGAEIDLVIKFSDNDIWAIEIKHGLSPKVSKHFLNTCDDIGATHRYVVYSGQDSYPIQQGAMVISLEDMMSKINILNQKGHNTTL